MPSWWSCTHKGPGEAAAVDELGGRPLWALAIEMRFADGGDELLSAVLQQVRADRLSAMPIVRSYIVTTIAFSSCSSSSTPRAACCASCFV